MTSIPSILITILLVPLLVTIEETLAFGILPSFSSRNNPILAATTATTVKLAGTSGNNKSNEEEEVKESKPKNLYSLLDEAVLLHSKVVEDNNNNEQDVQTLIEEIAHAMHHPKEDTNNLSSISPIQEQQHQHHHQQQQQQLQLQRTINDVRNELDKAVVHLQTLSLQDDEEKWTKVVEQLAMEYHELVSMEKESSSSSSSVSEEKETMNLKSMDEMIQGFELKLQKLHEINNPKFSPPSMIETNDNNEQQEIVSEVLSEENESTNNSSNDDDNDNLSDSSTNNIENIETQENDETIKATTISTTNNDQITTKSDIDDTTTSSNTEKEETIIEEEVVDVAIIGAGIGGLCAGSILNTLYGKKVGIYESHYLPGGCAHAFPATAIIDKDSKKQKVTFTFDSGPTIVLGCSTEPYNPLRQVLNAVGLSEEVEWIPYQGWGMVENPSKEKSGNKEIRWPVELGPDLFENGPLMQFGGEDAVKEFQELREVTKVLVSGAVEIPAMAMRSGNSALIPLLRYLPALSGLIAQGEEVTQGTFGQFMDGPKFVVKNQWLRDWLDALAFSLSGLPACRTSAAAMAYVIYDMHRDGAALDYPKGGLGAVIDALVKGVEQGSNGSTVNLRQHVQSIDTSPDGSYIQGLTLKNGKKIVAKDGVICNAPVWTLNELVQNKQARTVLNNALPIKKRSPRQTWTVSKQEQINKINYIRPPLNEGDADSLLAKCDSAEMTGSFLHLHLALDARNLDLDSLEAHYTVMDRGLGGDGSIVDGYADGPCAELNMIAVSNPCVLDRSLAPPGYIVVHAYGAGNEPYELWEGMDRNSEEYKSLKESRAEALWRAVESVIPDVKERVVLSMIGSPITHERFLRRPKGTYGASTEDYLKDGSTPYERLKLCGDGVFPGIGIPAVALSGASAANSMVSPWKQWKCLDTLKSQGLI